MTTGLSDGSITSAAAEASIRVAAFGARLERLGLDDYRQVALPALSSDDRASARAAAEQVADAQGLVTVWLDARRAVLTHMDRVYSGGAYHPTWAGLNWGLSTGPVHDRVAATVAVEDAALAAVVDGLAPAEVVDALRGPFELLSDAHPMPVGGDALPTLDDVRRLGRARGLIMIGFVAIAITALLAVSWPFGVVAAVVSIAALIRGRRAPQST